jgi:hypothetical protein
MKKHVDCDGQRTIEPCPDHPDYEGHPQYPAHGCQRCYQILLDAPTAEWRELLKLPAASRPVRYRIGRRYPDERDVLP